MMQHRYPFTVLSLAMDGSLLDINVHPTKMDLRFADNEKIYRLICEGIRGALTRRELIPNVSVGRETSQSPGQKRQSSGPPSRNPLRKSEETCWRNPPEAIWREKKPFRC